MRITIETIPHEQQRYNTIGDWQILGEDIVIRVSDTGYMAYNTLIAFHELVECVMCLAHGICQERVDEFDMSHPELNDPGSDLFCPYRKEHKIAESFEIDLAAMLNVPWRAYEKAIGNLCKTTSLDMAAQLRS